MKKLSFIFLLLFNQSIYAVTLSSIVDNKHETIIADKTNGKIYVYVPSTHTLISNPALYGRVKADKLDTSLKITPSGTFTSHRIFSTHLKSFAISFFEQKDTILAIHPVWTKLIYEKRVERLNSDTPNDNRITNGCINVSPDFFNTVLIKLPNNIKIVILSENESLSDDITNSITYD